MGYTYSQIMKVFLLLAMILPLALSTSRIAEMQVHTATWPGSGIEFQGHLSFTLCFGKKCCAINNADNWLINWQWDHLDEFHSEDLQECEGFGRIHRRRRIPLSRPSHNVPLWKRWLAWKLCSSSHRYRSLLAMSNCLRRVAQRR